MVNDEQQTEQPFVYDAFISYRHVERDRKWAEWLIDALEGYRVPNALQERGLPPRLRKIFRDEDEVPASADLNDQIRQALKESRFLIVVCSAFTPRSKWVVREIEIFNELGRGDQVLALLTEGEPGDSFPDAMLIRERRMAEPDGSYRSVKEDKEPLAADVRPRKGQSTEQLKRFALLRLVAVILGVKFDDLRKRDEERGRRGRRLWAATAAAFCLLTSGLGLLYLDRMRPVTAQYRQIVWRWGLPEGLATIDENTRRHLAISYKVIRKRVDIMAPPRLVEVRAENSAGQLRNAGTLLNDGDKWARWEILYREDGSAEQINGFNESGRSILQVKLPRERSSRQFIVNFTEQDDIPKAQDATQSLIAVDPAQRDFRDGKADISRHELTFDSNGFVTRRRYQNPRRQPQADGDGSFGESFINTSDGRIIRKAHIGHNDEEIVTRFGVRAQIATYDQGAIQIKGVGVDGKSIDGPDGYAHSVQKLDDWGNGVEVTYFDSEGQKALHKDGYATRLSKYDDRGFLSGVTFLGLKGEPTIHKNGFSSYQQEIDDRGNIIKVSYFGIDGKPTLTTFGVASFRQKFDGLNRLTERSYFDLDGKPTFGRDGYAGYRYSYHVGDPTKVGGLLNEVTYFGVDNNPTLHKDGYASYQREYNDSGTPTSTSYFGINHQLTLMTYGYAGFRTKYDSRGNKSGVEYFGVDNNPQPHLDGNYSYHQEFNTQGKLTEVFFHDADGKLTLLKNGYAGFHISYDLRGQATLTEYFGVDRGPILHKDGFASVELQYNDRGNVEKTSFFGTDRKLILVKNGYAGSRFIYNKRRLITKIEYFDVDNNPTLHKDGYASVETEFDSLSNHTSTSYFGIDRKLTLGINGHAGYRSSYDARSLLIGVIYFGMGREPKPHKDGHVSYRQKFNQQGKPTESLYLDANNKPTLIKDGYAGFRNYYDARGQVITKTEVFGVDREPTLQKDGYASFQRQYNERDKIIKTSYFGINGKPTLVKDGHAGFSDVYNERGLLTQRTFFGVDNNPILLKNGVAGYQREYDNRGNITKISYLGIDRQLKLIKDGYAGIRSSYNARDLKTDSTYFDVNDTPVVGASGYAKTVYEYDWVGREIRARYLDTRDREIHMGLVIRTVVKDSAAERIGFKPGDRIVSYDGKPLTSVQQYADRITDATGANSHELVVSRGPQQLTYKVAAGLVGIELEMQAANAMPAEPAPEGRLSPDPTAPQPDSLLTAAPAAAASNPP